MKNAFFALFVMVAVSTSLKAHAVDEDLFTYNPKIQGLTPEVCEKMNELGYELNSLIALTTVKLQNIPEEDQKKFARLIEAPVQKAKSNMFDLCYDLKF